MCIRDRVWDYRIIILSQPKNLQIPAIFAGAALKAAFEMCIRDSMTTYYQQIDQGGYITQWWYLPALEYKLEVVGIYHASYDNYG